ncbi:ABC transporter ATP-binding protein [Brachyspira hyodysenteriae]|uniref:ABC transporter ATP-binding protein n=1 Tax=Brachyspira hyodysenteriae TaxID=159 RepID=UPI00063DDA3A|nr:ABC transporter ATP-binding protein [Brachyspira hyodysenteriae]KLI22608.1 ABC transporter permease [Brachyspira hyodysenteriae]TVL61206.1 ABC transporter permease [Brachyspira hyodysenteriae]
MIKQIKEFFKKKEEHKKLHETARSDIHIDKYYSSDEKHVYRRMFKYAWKQKGLYFIPFILSLLYTVINILPPFFGQMAIALTGGKSAQLVDRIPFLKKLFEIDAKSILGDAFSSGNIFNANLLLQFTAVIIIGIVYVILRVGLDYFKSFLFGFCSQAINRDVQADMLKAVLNTDIGYFKQEREGTILARIGEGGVISGFVTGTFPNMITIPLTLILTLAVLFFLNVKLTLVCLIASPLIAIGTDKISKLIRPRIAKSQEMGANMSGIMQENMRGIEVIKIFSKEDVEVDRYINYNNEIIDYTRKMTMVSALNRPLVELIMIVAMLLILAYGGYLVFNGEMPFEFLWGFLLYMLNISTPVRDLSGLFVGLQSTKVIGKRVFQIMDLPQEKVDDKSKMEMKPIENSIEFKDVEFEYPRRGNEEPFKLGPINFKVKKGDIVAFVGNSGGGKTTLVTLIPKLFLPSSGQILFDGIDANEINTRSLRQHIGVVSQENILFYGSVRDNILYGDTEATDDDMFRAAKIAHADEFILKLPNGYDTHIGPRGIMLSGGQRQRIALARAVLRKPSILILDEATSALDTESEMYVQKALNEIINLQTTFVIAHRLSTIKNATYICVVEDGKIIESGTHEELMKKGGKYQYLYSLQFRDN